MVPPSEKWTRKICEIVNNSGMHCVIVLKFDIVLPRAFWGLQNCWNPLPVKSKMDIFKLQYLCCSVLLKFDTEFDHMTASTLQTFEVRWSEVMVKVREGHTVSAVSQE